jgi:alpha-amylase
LAIILVGGCTSGGPEGDPTTVPDASPQTGATSATPPAEYTTPDWFRQGALYQVFVRSFSDFDGDGIGDLRGIAGRLDYIQALGVNALWLTPIFESPSYHGYDTTDYYAIEPDFGEIDDLVYLVEQAHSRGIRVILDYVASHTSDQHPFFQDAYGNPESEYADWYEWTNDEHTEYQSFFDIDTLPSIDHTSEEANAYFLEMARHWMDLDGDGDFTDGIDGFRADYALGSPHAFWEQMRVSLKPLNPEVLLLGEVWVEDPSSQAPYLENQFDALFDFPLYIQLQGNPEIPGDGILNGDGFLFSLLSDVEQQKELFPAEAVPVRFVNNHDTNRVVTEVEGDPDRQRLAALLMATLDGTPMIYYGEEIGMAGAKGTGPIFDEYRREPMEWFAGGVGGDQATWFSGTRYAQPDDGVSVEEQQEDPGSLLSYYRAVYDLRRSTEVLSAGGYAPLPVEPDSDVWAFWRFTEDRVLSAIFNFGTERATVALDLSSAPAPLADVPFDLLTGLQVRLDPEAMILEPASGVLLDWTAA